MIHRSFAITLRTIVETLLPAACPVCAGPLGDHEGGVCLSCWSEVGETGGGRQPSPFRYVASVTSLGPYQGRLKGIIRCLKFSNLPGLAGPLGERLAARAAPLAPAIDVVVAVPLHRLRRWRRGYNQAELIAARLAGAIDRPLAAGALTRRRATASQRGRSRRERVANVRGAFRARGQWVAGRNVLLVDDVMTTGATLRECARVLEAAGTESVHAVTVARTLSRIDS